MFTLGYSWFCRPFLASFLSAGHVPSPAAPADAPALGDGGMLAETQPGSPPEVSRKHVEPNENGPVEPENKPEKKPGGEAVPHEDPDATSPTYSPESPLRDTDVCENGFLGPSGQKRKALPLDDDQEGSLEVLVPMTIPPEALSDRAIYMRLHRVFKKRKDGSYPLDDYWNKVWADIDGGGRDSVKAVFEKVGYQRDRVRQNISQ